MCVTDFVQTVHMIAKYKSKMSWPGFINRLLEATNKVEKVAIFNLEGVPVAVTDDITVSKMEGEALLRSLYDPSRSIALIHIDDIAFTCFQGNDNTLLGNNKSKGMTFVAYTAKDCIILVLGRSEGHGSFIFEVKRNLYMWDKGDEQGDQKPDPRKSRQSQNMDPNAVPRPTSLSQSGDTPAPRDQSNNLMDLDQDFSPSSPASDTAALSDEDILLDLSNQQQQVMY
ncbi:hypothetical protein LOTGIDRAFT_157675 [Lottia gigantea]|uniref:Uncharacterized protein n=1 Tax=Lottia gigantea TaxID=225164 RepID=V4AT69_LOTGI|nr:hypothetical protein LOTGIDRAFT_157675 [Lottia gigantea]ESP00468.1 hypothetical protein LOTGIDRAFT_157675 [Lottia gigantea]